MGRYIYGFHHRLFYESGESIRQYTERTNEALEQLQAKGANIVDVQFFNYPHQGESMSIIVSLIVYEAKAPIEIELKPSSR